MRKRFDRKCLVTFDLLAKPTPPCRPVTGLDFKAGLAICIISILLSFPTIDDLLRMFIGSEMNGRFDVFARQVADPWYRIEGEAGFTAFRILLPSVLHIVGAPAWSYYFVSFFAGAFLIAIVLSVLAERGVPRRAALAFCLCLALTPVIQSSHIYLGYPDTISWLILAALMKIRKPLAWTPLIIAGMFNDERLIIGVPFVVAIRLVDYRRDPFLRLLPRVAPYAVATVSAFLLYLLLREGIRTGVIGGAPVTTPVPHDHVWPSFGYPQFLALVASYTALWAIIVIGVIRDVRGSSVFWFLIVIYAIFASFVLAWPADYWRGLAVLFPLFVLAMIVFSEYKMERVSRVMVICAAVAVCLPQIHQIGSLIIWIRPFPVSIFEYFSNMTFRQFIGAPSLLDLFFR